MAEPRSAVAGFTGGGAAGHGVTVGPLAIIELTELQAANQSAKAGLNSALPALLSTLNQTDERAHAMAIPTGSGRWLLARTGTDVISPAREPVERAALSQALGTLLHDPGFEAWTTDLSDARVALSLAGPATLELLARGCPIDLESLAIGDGLRSLLGPFTVELQRLEHDSFVLLIPTSHACSAMDWLHTQAQDLDPRFAGECS